MPLSERIREKIRKAKEIIDGKAVKKIASEVDAQHDFYHDDGEFRDYWNYRPGSDRWNHIGKSGGEQF